MPIKPLGPILHGLCFLGVNVFAIECIRLSSLQTLFYSKLLLNLHVNEDSKTDFQKNKIK